MISDGGTLEIGVYGVWYKDKTICTPIPCHTEQVMNPKTCSAPPGHVFFQLWDFPKQSSFGGLFFWLNQAASPFNVIIIQFFKSSHF